MTEENEARRLWEASGGGVVHDTFDMGDPEPAVPDRYMEATRAVAIEARAG